MTKKDDYQCPRCGYHTPQKSHMRIHLYCLKKPCPASQSLIEVNEEIRRHVLNNRVYKPTDAQHTEKVTINNYNVINALISNMDPIEKLTKYIDYKHISIVDIDDHIEDTFMVKSKKLETNKLKNFSMSINDMLEVVDSITTICQVENLNIIYDEKLNKLKFFSCGSWKSSLIDGGIKELIEKIQSCYLDAYECYLLRKIESSSVYEKKQATEHLEQYYRFIACFDITPYIVDKNNNQVLFNVDDERYHKFVSSANIHMHSIQDTWYSKYKKIKSEITLQEHNKVTRSVKDIIKRNTRNNVVELNKKMMELFQMDESYKTKVIKEITMSISIE